MFKRHFWNKVIGRIGSSFLRKQLPLWVLLVVAAAGKIQFCLIAVFSIFVEDFSLGEFFLLGWRKEYTV